MNTHKYSYPDAGVCIAQWRLCFRHLLLWVCLVLSAPNPVANAQQTAEAFKPPARWLGHDIPLRWLEDSHGSMTPDEVLSPKDGSLAWRESRHALSLGYSKTVVWITFDVPAAATPGDPVWLLAHPTYLDSVVLYEKDPATGEWQLQQSGDLVPAQLKPGIRQHLFRLEPGRPALVRIQTTSAVQFRGVILPSAEALGSELASIERTLGLFFGVMLSLLLGIWASCAIFRSRYLYALALLGTVSTLHVFNIRGYPSLWASGNWAIWASHAVGIGAFALAAAVAWQIRNQLTRNSPYHRTDRVLVGLTILNCLGIVAVPLGFYSSVAWINLASVLISDCIAIVLCVNALILRRRRVQHALLLAAYIIHFLGGVPTAVVLTGITPLNLDMPSILQAQILVFTGILSAAVFGGLVLRFRQAEELKSQALQDLSRSEQALEERIAQRTRELSETQLMLRELLDSERRLRDEQRQFFHMISHEFRTPLAVVDSAASEQQSFPSPDLQTQMDRATQIRGACRRLTSLIDSCLINERLDSTSFSLYPAAAKVSELLNHAAQLVHWSPRHRLRLMAASAPTDWICDQALVRIALSNLVDNAVKYAAAGEISITARQSDAGLLEISVADEGSGMSPEIMSRIFQQFEQGHRTDQNKGFGLGLWVSRRVARLHGGDVTVESQQGHGACFTLTLAPQRISTRVGT